MLVKKSEKWDFGISMAKIAGLEPSEEMKSLIEKEKKGEITMDEVKRSLDRIYKTNDKS